MTTRIGIVGCGFIGGIHSRALRALAGAGMVDAAVTAVHDLDPDRAAALAGAHPGAAVAGSATALLDRVDAVWVCTPTSSHRALVEAAAAAGVAVYAEKPLATSLADVVAMVDAVDAAGVAHQVGLVLRNAEPLVCLQRVLAGEPSTGRAMAAVLRDDQYFPNQGQYGSAWRADVAVAGGGTLLEHSIHDIDVLAWLLGPVVQVACRTANYAGHPGVEDVAVATFTHRSGATSTLLSVWHQVLSRPSIRRLEVFCEHALLWLDHEDEGPVHVERDGGKEVLEARTGGGWADRLAVPDGWRQPLAKYAAADRAFLEALRAGRRPAPGFDVALVAHAVADAAYRSAADGGTPRKVALLDTPQVRDNGAPGTA